MLKNKKKKRVTSVSIREDKKKDRSPQWDDHEELSTEQFNKRFRDALTYYSFEYTVKDLKPNVLTWMELNEYNKEEIKNFKNTKDWRCISTLTGLVTCLLKGMPPIREDFNNGRDSSEWVHNKIKQIIKDGANDIDEDNPPKSPPKNTDILTRLSEDIETELEKWETNSNKFNKDFDVLSSLKTKDVKVSQARLIKDYYSTPLNELLELASGNADEQLREGYNHKSKKQIRSVIDFYKNIVSACDMIIAESKITQKPKKQRKPKEVSKDKLIAKLKYKTKCDTYKLVSSNPANIIGAKELWVFNCSTRKLGKYVANENETLNVKGTTIINFDVNKSIQKTLRKPAEQLDKFKNSGKIALRKFMDEIVAVDTKLNGRINDEIILLKIT